MKAFIFTYGPDYPMASIAASALERLGVDAVWALDAWAQKPPEGTRKIYTAVPRNGNLNGIRWTIAQLEAMLEYADGSEWVLKVDSDTLVLGLDWLKDVAKSVDAVGTCSSSRPFYGCCYALRTSAIPRLIRGVRERGVEGVQGEDLIIEEVLCHSRLRVAKYAYSEKTGPLGVWRNDGKDKELAEKFPIVWVQRPIVTRKGHERDDVISSMKAISAHAGITLTAK